MTVPLARRNLTYDKGKFVTYILGISATLTLIILLIGLREGMYTSATSYIDRIDVDLIVVQNGSDNMLSANSSIPTSQHQPLAEVTGAEIAHVLIGDIIFTHDNHKTPVLLIGYNPTTGIGGPWNIAKGERIHNDTDIMLDIWLAQRSNVKIGDNIQLLGKEFHVVGLTRETSSWMSPYVFVSQRTAEELLQLPSTASFYLLRLPEDVKVEETRQLIEKSFSGVDVLTPEEMAQADRKILATAFETPIRLIILIGFGVGLIVMGLTVHLSVRDHKREYAILKAIGGNRRLLQRTVFNETIYRAGIGFGIAILLSKVIAYLIMYFMPQFTIVIQPEIIGIVGVATILIAILSASIPLRHILVIDPNDVFKQ